MLEPFILLLELLCLEHKPRPWVIRVYRAVLALGRRSGDLVPRNLTEVAAPSEPPCGTAGAMVSASQPPPPRQQWPTPYAGQFAYNNWMQWEAAGRLHACAARMAVT